ncbi:MAG: hypothetical protein HYV27_12845 [Candidatus Hydrogenedentes bacterium]|nr:hypothetical protein [Candidatus Hydrogenedentota bacterium]
MGAPEISGTTYSFPILLESDDSNVAALNFTFRYDATSFDNLGAVSGAQALQANKLVTASAPEPGSMVVVLVGMNQNTMASGEVARIQLEQKNADLDSGAQFQLLNESLATAEGLPIPSGVRGHDLPPKEGTQPPEEKPPAQDPPKNSDTPAPNANGAPPSLSGIAAGAVAPISPLNASEPRETDPEKASLRQETMLASSDPAMPADAEPGDSSNETQENIGLDKPSAEGVHFRKLEVTPDAGGLRVVAQSADAQRSIGELPGNVPDQGDSAARGPKGGRWSVAMATLVGACALAVFLRRRFVG